MTLLYDLRLTLADLAGGTCRVHYELLERSPYPSAPRAEGTTISYADQGRVLDTAWEEIPFDSFIPAILARPTEEGLRDRASLEALNTQWPLEPVTARTQEVFYNLFPGPRDHPSGGRGWDLLARWLDRVPPADAYRPWGTPEVVGRLTLQIDSPALRDVAWELAAPGQRLVCRRSPLPAGERSCSFDLPLTVAVDKCSDAIRYVDGWGEGLFDSFTHGTRAMGGFEWTERAEDPVPGQVHHVVYDSGSDASWDEMLSALQSYKAEDPYRRPDRVPPRLLVLHDVSARIPSYLITRLVYVGLALGADAVLLASFDTSDPAAGGFFPMFYRKVMHNWPLDQCLRAALAETARHSALQGWIFGAREGGELSLLLTRTVVEKAQDVPVPKGVSGFPAAPSRQERVMADLQARLQRATEAWRQKMVTEVEQAASITFDEEAHGVWEMVQNRERVHEAARAVGRGVDALTDVTLMGPQQFQQVTVRTTNLWLTDPGRECVVAPDEALVALQPYTLHLNIAPPVAEALLSTRFPFDILEPFEKERYLLDVIFFSPDTDFRLEPRKAILELPQAGASNEIALAIIPQAAGRRRLRACIYYHNVLLQSVLVEATVVDKGASIPDGASIACTIDYVASADLALLDELPRPTLSLFTNQAADGTHWIGVFGADESSGIQIRRGDMHTFDPGWLAKRAERLRDLLAEIEGKKAYRFEALPPFSGHELDGREKDLVDLALAGWKLYDDLFLSHEAGLDMDRLTDLRAALQLPGLVCVARCRGDSTTIPWAALYDLPLDTDKEDETKLCPVFRDHLAANRWSGDGKELMDKHDLLDDPQQCRDQAQCPLGDRKLRRVTICPLGFWGILHQVEQPLQQVTPTAVDQVPEELSDPGFSQTSFLVRAGDDKVRMAMGIYPGIPDGGDHRLEIAALAPSALEIDWKEDRDQVLTMLEEGGYHFYYFYCHGEVEEGEFKLKLGPSASPGYIASADLDPFEIRWSGQRQPLVILNGCETMALTPELIHGFLGKLRRLGALGIVGTEVKVWTQLARPLGRLVLKHLLEGRSLGEAFLEARKHLLRQYNPLGLVYTLHAPATLHLHDPAGCDWCRMHLPAGLAWGGG
jgi:hypothetical protein